MQTSKQFSEFRNQIYAFGFLAFSVKYLPFTVTTSNVKVEVLSPEKTGMLIGFLTLILLASTIGAVATFVCDYFASQYEAILEYEQTASQHTGSESTNDQITRSYPRYELAQQIAYFVAAILPLLFGCVILILNWREILVFFSEMVSTLSS
jgi:hypothetical protein